MTQVDLTTIFSETIANRDWVEERAKCRVRDAFQVLAARITRDVKQFKELDKEQRKGGVISLDQNHGYHISVVRDQSGIPAVNRPYVIFEVSPDDIEINMGAAGAVRVKPVWDPDSRTAKFHVGDDDKLHTASQLSERFLLRILFPDFTNHDT